MNHREQLKYKKTIRAIIEDRLVEFKDVILYIGDLISNYYDFTIKSKKWIFYNKNIMLKILISSLIVIIVLF